MRQKFDSIDGKVVFIEIEEVKFNYPEGTLKVEVKFYPVGPGSYSSFIYTNASLSEIQSKMAVITDEFLNSGQNSFSSSEISQKISKHLNPIFPAR